MLLRRVILSECIGLRIAVFHVNRNIIHAIKNSEGTRGYKLRCPSLELSCWQRESLERNGHARLHLKSTVLCMGLRQFAGNHWAVKMCGSSTWRMHWIASLILVRHWVYSLQPTLSKPSLSSTIGYRQRWNGESWSMDYKSELLKSRRINCMSSLSHLQKQKSWGENRNLGYTVDLYTESKLRA